MTSNFDEIQELLRSRADLQARLALIPYDGTPEIKENASGKYLYVRKREAGKLSSVYVDKYSDQMKSTLLMPAGVTSLASINFKDEDKLLSNAENVDETYINKILPKKMKYNLEYIEKFNLIYDFKIMFKTVFAVAKNNA